MKSIILLLTLLVSFSSFALTRDEVEAMLKAKNISLKQMEQKGNKVLLGEVTGHIKAIPFAKVQVVLTQNQAILKNEIDSVSFKTGQVMGEVLSVRFQGQYLLKEDVKGVIILGQ